MSIITKPGIAAGVAAAGIAGMALAGRGMPDPFRAFLCVLCILMAAWGSAIINVLAEEDTDALMPRVAKRKAALDRLGRGRALGLAVLLIAASLALSFFSLGAAASMLVLAAVLSYALLYTLYLKRRSPYGTVAGGIPGALPALIGYASVTPVLGLDAFILFAIMLLWQPPHFLALALKYRGEYAAAGIPVMPLARGERYTKAFMLLYAAALPPLAPALWLFGYSSGWFAAFGFMLGWLFLAACYIYAVKGSRHGRAFAASVVYIMAMLAGVVADAGLNGAG